MARGDLKFALIAEDKFSAEINKAVRAAKSLVVGLNGVQKEVRELNANVKAMSAQMSAFTESVRRSQSRFRGFAGSISAAIRPLNLLKQALAFGGIFLGVSTLIGLFSRLRSAIVSTFQVGAQFQQEMGQIRGILRPLGEEFRNGPVAGMIALQSTALELGRTSLYSAKQVAEAMTVMARAGVDAVDILNAIGPATRLAEAGMLDLREAASISVQIMKALNRPTEELSGIMDTLALTAARSNQTISDIGKAFAFAASAVDLAGGNVADTASALGILANAGIRATIAGTALRKMLATVFRDMQRSGTAIGRAADQLFKFENGRRVFVGFADAVEILRREGLDASNAFQVFGVRAGNAFAILSQAGGSSIRAFREELEKADGFAKQLADDIKDNLAGDVTILKSAFESLSVVITEAGTGPLRAFVQGMTEAVTKLIESEAFFNLMGRAIQFGTTLLLVFARVAVSAAGFVLRQFAKFLVFWRDLADNTQQSTTTMKAFLIDVARTATDVFAVVGAAIVKGIIGALTVIPERARRLLGFGDLDEIGERAGRNFSMSFKQAADIGFAKVIDSSVNAVGDGFKKLAPPDAIKSTLTDLSNELGAFAGAVLPEMARLLDENAGAMDELTKKFITQTDVAKDRASLEALKEQREAIVAIGSELSDINSEGIRVANQALKDFGAATSDELDSGVAVLSRAAEILNTLGRVRGLELLRPKIVDLAESFEKRLGGPLQQFIGINESGLPTELTDEIADLAAKAGLLDDPVTELIRLLDELDQNARLAAVSGNGLTEALERIGLVDPFADQAAKIREIDDSFRALEAIEIALEVRPGDLDLTELQQQIINKIRELRSGLDAQSLETPITSLLNEDTLNAALQPFSQFEQISAKLGVNFQSAKDQLDLINTALMQNRAESNLTNAEYEIAVANLERMGTELLDKLVPGMSELTKAGVVNFREQLALLLEDFDLWRESAEGITEVYRAQTSEVVTIGQAIQMMIADADTFQKSIDAGKVRVQSLGKDLAVAFGRIGVNAANALGNAIAEAATGGDVAWGDFFKNFIKQIIASIIQAIILRALYASLSFGTSEAPATAAAALSIANSAALIGGFGIGGGKYGLKHGGIVPAANNGLIVPGVDLGKDSVPIIARPGEAVLPPNLTNLLLRAAMNPEHRLSTGGDRDRQRASMAERPIVLNITNNITSPDREGVRRLLEDNHEELARSYRRAIRLGSL